MLRLKMRERNGVARKRQATTSRDVVNTKASRETVNTVPRDASVLRSRLTPLLDVVLHFRSWRRPTLPRPRSRSTIGADRLNDRVRDGNGCGPVALVASKQPTTTDECVVLPRLTSRPRRDQASRAISTARLKRSRALDLPPINLVVS